MVITRVGPMSCAKIAGTLYVIIGIIVGGAFSMIAMAGGFSSEATAAAGIGAVLGVAAVIIFPIFYGCMGFVATLIAAWLYNVVAGLVGGIEIEVQ
jgi:hypothetical protein